MFSALEIQDELQTLYTSGTVFHAFLGEKLPDWKAAANLVRKIAENHKLPYYTLSPTYSVCPDHGYISGEVYTCPKCGRQTEVYSRITGYYRPVQNWNAGKSEEFKDRKVYDVTHSHLRVTPDTLHKEAASMKEEVKAETPKAKNSSVILFTTKTCPNCKVAAALLEKAGVVFEKLLVEENREMAQKYGFKQVPTLIDGEKLYSGVPAIKQYLA